MKVVLVSIGFIFLIIMAFPFSCKKELSYDACIEGNKPPIASAGPDHVITLPTDSEYWAQAGKV